MSRSRRPSAARRWVTALSWPVGIVLTCWDYMWRTTPLHRREVAVAGSAEGHRPPELPAGVDREQVVGAKSGHGPLFHRRYRARIRGAEITAEGLLEALEENLNRAAPTAFARFVKVRGARGVMRTGDEYVVRMPGPWDGPVRVVAQDERVCRLATLEGHLEAGQIEFRVSGTEEELVFEIESWARSASRLSHLLYHHLRMAKEVQFHMWVSFLEGVARLARGRIDDGVTVETFRVEGVT